MSDASRSASALQARLARLALCVVCGLSAGAGAQGRVVVGSKAFTESRILAEVMAQQIERETDISVERRTNLGGTLLVLEAMKAGEIDLYAEYTGTAWATVLKRSDSTPPLQTYVVVQRHFEENLDMTWLAPLGFSNSYALAVRPKLAARLGLKRLSDLRPHLAELRFSLSHEFIKRADGWPGLKATYRWRAAEGLNTPRGMEHGLAYEAVIGGATDIIDTYTTDAKLARFDLVVLEDDAQFFPPYDCAPVVRREVLRLNPTLAPALQALAYRIDSAAMQGMNAAVEVDGLSYAAAAKRFLDGLEANASAADRGGSSSASSSSSSGGSSGSGAQPGGATAWTRLWPALSRHIWLTLVALLLAVLVGVPLGLLLTRRKRFAAVVIGATGVIQTVPSLALLAFMIPIPGLGLGSRSAILALFLYALLPIVRNTYTGIVEVDPKLVDAARGLGLSDAQRLRHIELPLALVTIMAGIRTSAVISIGVATLAAFIGAGGLGDLILTGLQLNDTSLIVQGALPAALLAILTDAGLGVLERRWASES